MSSMNNIHETLAKKIFLYNEPSGLSNPRYPQYPTIMEDARNLTSYRNRCENNIDPSNQYHTKLWMIHHATELINESRRQYEDKLGCSIKETNTVPPPEFISYQTPFTNGIYPTENIGGVGIFRADTTAPPLFGTFTKKCNSKSQNDVKKIQLTSKHEGGRNSFR